MSNATKNFRAGFTWTLPMFAAAALGETIAGIGDFTQGHSGAVHLLGAGVRVDLGGRSRMEFGSFSEPLARLG